jgi:DNA-binding Xre family transcriptional regulator
MVRWQLKELAEAKGFNKHSLSLAAGLSYNTVRPMWLNTARRADLDTIDRLSRVLQVSPGDLMVRVEDEVRSSVQ